MLVEVQDVPFVAEDKFGDGGDQTRAVGAGNQEDSTTRHERTPGELAGEAPV
jgi:hypothetical protein